MAKIYHHIRILEADWNRLRKFRREFESDSQAFNRMMGIIEDLPDKYLVWGLK